MTRFTHGRLRCSLTRPDVFQSVTMMSAPFAGPPVLPFGTADRPRPPVETIDIELALGRLSPPRKHHHWYYATRRANGDMRHCEQGLHAFLRAYYHHKSGDWPGNRPFPLTAWSAEELMKLPTYYVMRQGETMAQTVAHEMPSQPQTAACQWLPDEELAFYVSAYERTGFQGGLQWYRCRTTGLLAQELATFSGRTIDVPSSFIAGSADSGVFQKPGDFETMQTSFCTQMEHVHLVEGVGHWVQQERPEAVQAQLLSFLRAQGHDVTRADV
jgi:pimeloyl-ACP methyl ester carboxylesterase